MLPVLILAGSLAAGQSPKPQVTSHPLPAPKSLAETVITPGQPTPPVTPATTPSLNDCLRACPPTNDPAPFLRAPHQEPLGQCKDGPGCGGGPVLPGDCHWRHTFHTAARFSIPRFSQQGEPVEADGVLIYEGMRLTVNPNTGVYDLSFTATTPPTPVTVRLQLIFHPPGEPDKSVRLTLPPIDIEPEASKSPRAVGTTVRVSHRGFSELFLDQNLQSGSSDLREKLPLNILEHPPATNTVPNGFQVTKAWTVVRAGTARFGSALPTNDDSGR